MRFHKKFFNSQFLGFFGIKIVEAQTQAPTYRDRARAALGRAQTQIPKGKQELRLTIEQALEACQECDYQSTQICGVIQSYIAERHRKNGN